MTRLANHFQVLWINPAEHWQKALLPPTRLRARNEAPLSVSDFLVHTSSPFLPQLYSHTRLAAYFFRRRLESARELLLHRGCTKVVLYLWRPEFASALQFIRHDLSCYHIDDEYSFSASDLPLSEEEKSLIAEVGQVFIHSPALLQKKGSINPHTRFVPNGVDFESYSRPVPQPVDLQGIPHPRIGYSGRIKRQLDWSLLRELTARHPDWHFVLVGGVNPHPEISVHIDHLSRQSNVHFLGDKTTIELAAYPQHFDVCIMPYVRDGYTKYIYPLKLHEYLAGGKPVVGTPIPSLEPFHDSIRLAESADQWSLALRESLGALANTEEARIARQAVARSHDWNALVEQIASTIVERLASI